VQADEDFDPIACAVNNGHLLKKISNISSAGMMALDLGQSFCICFISALFECLPSDDYAGSFALPQPCIMFANCH